MKNKEELNKMTVEELIDYEVELSKQKAMTCKIRRYKQLMEK